MGLLLPALAVGALLLFSGGKPRSKDNTLPPNITLGPPVSIHNGVMIDVGPGYPEAAVGVMVNYVTPFARENPDLTYHFAQTADEGFSVTGARDNHDWSEFGEDIRGFDEAFDVAHHFALTGETP